MSEWSKALHQNSLVHFSAIWSFLAVWSFSAIRFSYFWLSDFYLFGRLDSAVRTDLFYFCPFQSFKDFEGLKISSTIHYLATKLHYNRYLRISALMDSNHRNPRNPALMVFWWCSDGVFLLIYSFVKIKIRSRWGGWKPDGLKNTKTEGPNLTITPNN